MQLNSGTDDNLAGLARFQLAGVYDQEGKSSQAVDLYNQLSDKPSVFVPKPMVLLALADHYRKTDPTQAAKLYNQVKQQFPDAAEQSRPGPRITPTQKADVFLRSSRHLFRASMNLRNYCRVPPYPPSLSPSKLLGLNFSMFFSLPDPSFAAEMPDEIRTSPQVSSGLVCGARPSWHSGHANSIADDVEKFAIGEILSLPPDACPLRFRIQVWTHSDEAYARFHRCRGK